MRKFTITSLDWPGIAGSDLNCVQRVAPSPEEAVADRMKVVMTQPTEPVRFVVTAPRQDNPAFYPNAYLIEWTPAFTPPMPKAVPAAAKRVKP